MTIKALVHEYLLGVFAIVQPYGIEGFRELHRQVEERLREAEAEEAARKQSES